jgi:hypothetical protein
MQHLENNKIAESLHSLEAFPEGYQPNLEAKWQILEAGLPSEAKIFSWKRLMVAAILLLLAGACIFVYTNSNQTKPEIASAIIKQPETVFPVNTEPVEIVIEAPKATAKKRNMKPEVVKPAKNNIKQEQVLVTIDQTHENINVEAGVETMELPVVVPSVAKKPNKKRSFTRDFDGIPVKDSFEKTASKSFQFKFFSNRQSSEGSAPQLRISQSF